MYVKLDREVFENCNKTEEHKSLLADITIFTENGNTEHIPSATTLTTVYIVKNKPKDSIENGIKWIICTPRRCTFRDCFR